MEYATLPLVPTSKPLKAANDRLDSLPLYVFAQLAEGKEALRAKGVSLIDLGMGNPDQPTPTPIIEALQAAVANPENHGYPSFEGKASFREAVAGWMKRRYEVHLNPSTQVQPLIGSKEGIANLIYATLGPGDICLVPELYYPTYMRATIMTGAEAYQMPLLPEVGYLPDLDAIPATVCQRAKLLLLNYPNNPTGAVAPDAFYEKAIAFAKRHNLILVSDMAYGEVAFEGYRPRSILEFEGAQDVAVEFHSFSKTFHMAGWRLGWAVGAEAVIRALYLGKTTTDYGVCNAIQDAGTFALQHAEEFITPMCQMYQARQTFMCDALEALGWQVERPKASFYLWLKVPPAFEGSFQWCYALMERTGVVITPGAAFGPAGDGYFRLSLVSPMETLQAAVTAMHQANISFGMKS